MTILCQFEISNLKYKSVIVARKEESSGDKFYLGEFDSLWDRKMDIVWIVKKFIRLLCVKI